jgi:O-antigen/teichoic acid export membrane protein
LGDAALTRYLKLIYLVLGLPIVLLLGIAIVFAEPLLNLLYGDVYLEYSNGILWMVIFYALLYAYMPLQSIFKATERSKPIFYANLAAIAAMFTVGTWAVTRFNVYGTLAGQALNALIISLMLWGYWLRKRDGGNKPAESPAA